MILNGQRRLTNSTRRGVFLPPLDSMEARSISKRPPSYSDSFLFLPESLPIRHTTSLNSFSTALEQQEQQYQQDHQEQQEQQEHQEHQDQQEQQEQQEQQGQQSRQPYTTCERWNSRILSFSLHILLISLFETLFFFLFVSKTEDAGLQQSLDNYLVSTLATCSSWSPNTTLVLNDILSLLLNATAVQEQGLVAAQRRHQFNEGLEWIAWSYTVGLATLFVSLGIGACSCRCRIAWKRILIENGIMIALLGLYETIFFRTIIYRYQTMTESELTAFLVGQLQTTCGL